MSKDFRQINPNVKSLYAFLKKYNIEKYFLTKDYKIASFGHFISHRPQPKHLF